MDYQHAAEAMLEIVNDPSTGAPLEGTDSYRVIVQNIKIIYQYDETTIAFLHIGAIDIQKTKRGVNHP
jgi:hypothetical protein